MMTPERLAQLREFHVINPGSTHYEGCGSEHTACAVVPLLDEIDRLRAESRVATGIFGECDIGGNGLIETITNARQVLGWAMDKWHETERERDAALARVKEQDALLRTFAEHFKAWTDDAA